MRKLAPEKRDPKTIVGKLNGRTPEDRTARLVVDGMGSNTVATMKWSEWLFKDMDATAMQNAMIDAADAVNEGDLGAAEALLIAQVSSLNSVFTYMLTLAKQTQQQDNQERCLRLAFKAQAQCRATCETISAIKNPPVFARQANIANGPQQVNNGVLPRVEGLAHAEKPKTKPIGLLEAKDERVDTGTTREAGAGDKELATVGTINRTKKR